MHPETKETGFQYLESVSNLVYYICDNNYSDVLEINLKHLYQHNNVDTCCIAPHGFIPEAKYAPTHIHYVDDFDYKYTAKFIIGDWDKIYNYENILYLDVDAIPKKDLGEIFETIQNQNDIIHGVVEKISLNNSDSYHKFSNDHYPDNTFAYNAGTFGFNIKMLNIFKDYLLFTSEIKNIAELDQPIFNEFFNKIKLIQPTLSKFVHLYNMNDIYKDINQTSLDSASIVHFLGNAYSGKNINIINSILTS